MGTEDPPIDVEFVENDVAEVGKELLPLRVVGKDSRVQHVRVGDDDMALFADGLAGIIRGVPVVREGLDIRLKGLDGP
jgi:hypothetical protein